MGLVAGEIVSSGVSSGDNGLLVSGECISTSVGVWGTDASGDDEKTVFEVVGNLYQMISLLETRLLKERRTKDY